MGIARETSLRRRETAAILSTSLTGFATCVLIANDLRRALHQQKCPLIDKILMPILGVVIIASAVTVFWTRYKIDQLDRRRAIGLCLRCGNDLRRTAAPVCPQCGADRFDI